MDRYRWLPRWRNHFSVAPRSILPTRCRGSSCLRHPNKAELQARREAFAVELRQRGVVAEATPRRMRGVSSQRSAASHPAHGRATSNARGTLEPDTWRSKRHPWVAMVPRNRGRRRRGCDSGKCGVPRTVSPQHSSKRDSRSWRRRSSRSWAPCCRS